MNELENQNSLITAEANKILYEKGLWTMLSKYGKPAPTGSYVLGLMVWRDLDIYIESNEMTESKFFELGAELASVLKPHRMQYLNEFLIKRDHLPLGFYCGVLIVSPDFPEEWKIDLWAIDSEQLKGFK